MKLRNLIAFILLVVSFILLIPGLTKDLITITASVQFMGISHELMSETRSILQTVQRLHESGYPMVAGLILLFSVVVPVAKGLLLAVALAIKNARLRFDIYRFVKAIGKWSMADVFLVGVYVAFLSARAGSNLDARIEPGFYYFTAYCLVSLLSLQFMQIEPPKESWGPKPRE